MGIFDSVNTSKKTVMDGVDTEDMEFVKLREFVGQKVPTKGFFFTNGGKFGKSVVVVGESVLINMPNWTVPKFETIEASETMMKAVLSGKMALDNIREIPTDKGNPTVLFDVVEM